MTDSHQPSGGGYDSFYERFDTPLMQDIRSRAYGRDIGQHSWVTAEELEEDIVRLQITSNSRLLDLGCGPGGVLGFVVNHTRCRATGIDVSPAAIASAHRRIDSLGLHLLVELGVADANERLPCEDACFSAVLSADSVLHFRDRESVFNEIARVLEPGGRFLFTDAGVLTGAVSDDEIRRHSIHGFTQFAPAGFNERALERAGFRALERVDRTASLLINAKGRLAARLAHQEEIEQLEGHDYATAQHAYLETVITLAERGAVSRVMHLAEKTAT